MFDAKATDNSIDKSDDKNDEENDVVQNICSGLRFRVIDVHPTDDEEEEANDHLMKHPVFHHIRNFMSFQSY